MRPVLPITLLLAGCAMMPSSHDDATSLAQAERAFAAQSMRSDMSSAFLANFAHDGVLVSDGWATAREQLEGKPAPPINLDWAPSHVEVAASGELGLSTGPWIRTSRTKPEASPAHGHFVSVWRRDDDGKWRVEVDIGIAHEQAVAATADVEIVQPSPMAASSETLESAEARFVEASMRAGPRLAYEASASPRFLLYRQGHVPYRGKAAALASDRLGDAPTVWLADNLAVSRSNDFGYVRGSYAAAGDPQRLGGYFLRVWRREGGRWRIVLDVTNAAR